MNERDQTVDEGKQDGKHHPKKNHKYVISDELCVFVDEARGIVQCWEGFCTLVLVETLLEVKLERREYKFGYKYYAIILRLWSTFAKQTYNTTDEQCNFIITACSRFYSRSSEPLGCLPAHIHRPRRAFVPSPPAPAF